MRELKPVLYEGYVAGGGVKGFILTFRSNVPNPTGSQAVGRSFVVGAAC